MRIVFMGTPEFAVPSLRALVDAHHVVLAVYTQPDRPQGRGRVLEAPPVKVAANLLGLPVRQPESLRAPEEVAALADLSADLYVVVAYGQILTNRVLSLPRLGAVNVHASLLPKYRGAAPVQWAVLNGERETGVSAMWIERKLDSGDIIYQKSRSITRGESSGELLEKLALDGAGLLVKTIADIEAGSAPRAKQDDAGASYARQLLKEDGRLDLANESAQALERRVAAMNPWPVAFCERLGESLRVWRAEEIGEAPQARPGEVARVSSAGIDIACKQGTLRLLEVQPAGKKRMTAGSYISGFRVQTGEIWTKE